MSKVIGVKIDGQVEWHVVNAGPTDHDTLCGIDSRDPGIGHEGTVDAPRGQVATCNQCYLIWAGIHRLRLRARDFGKRP